VSWLALSASALSAEAGTTTSASFCALHMNGNGELSRTDDVRRRNFIRTKEIFTMSEH
jgi:hypothetical protein